MGKAQGGGSGWVLLTSSPRDRKLVNQWAMDHTMTLAGGRPIFALDMYEHSYHPGNPRSSVISNWQTGDILIGRLHTKSRRTGVCKGIFAPGEMGAGAYDEAILAVAP
jgi:hypothetical protein